MNISTSEDAKTSDSYKNVIKITRGALFMMVSTFTVSNQPKEWDINNQPTQNLENLLEKVQQDNTFVSNRTGKERKKRYFTKSIVTSVIIRLHK